MTYDEVNKHLFEVTEAYRKLVKWNRDLRARLEEMTGHRAEWRDFALEQCRETVPKGECPWGIGAPEWSLDWEEK